MCFEDEFFKFVLLTLYCCFVSWCLVYCVSLYKYHMLFEDELYEVIALLKALHCWRHCIAYFLCWWFVCYITYIFLSFFLLLSVKNDQHVFNWLSLKERKYKIIVVPYKCCTISWKHWYWLFLAFMLFQ